MEIKSYYPINETALVEISEILKDYDILVSKKFRNDDSSREFLVDSNSKLCRFCGKFYPEVKFKSEAHTIPEFMGNKRLFSKFECDTCNERYFSSFENEMANYMLSHNVLAGTKSKNNKISKYKQKGQAEIINGTENISISDVQDSLISEINNDNLEITIKIPSYIPDFIYRCLVKIGLSVIPEKNLCIYKNTIEWLMNPDYQSNLKPFMLFSMYPFQVQSDEIACNILERKDNCVKNFPHSILFLSYNNFAFQTCLPFSSKEKLETNLKAFPFIFPMTLDLNKNLIGMRTYNYIDLSSRKKTKNETVTYTISGERTRKNKNTKR